MAQETSSPCAGATLAGELISDATYVPFPRSLIQDVVHRKLTVDQYLVLAWLYPKANYRNGVVYLSYAGVAQALQGKYSTNKVNKIFTSLKEQGYLLFDKQQGRRGEFPVFLDNFLFPNKTRRDLSGKFDDHSSRSDGRSIDADTAEVQGDSDAEETPEVARPGQNLPEAISDYVTEYFPELDSSDGRSPNNENENEEQETNKTFSFALNENAKSRYESENEYEQRELKRIAIELGEPDLKFLTWAYEMYGIDVISEAYEYTLQKHANGGIGNIRKYFNHMVRKFGEEAKSE